VHYDDVPHVEVDAAGADSISDALHFVAIFLINVRPPDVSCGFAEELPVFAIVVREFEKENFLQVGDFRSEEVTVLEADLFGRAGEAHHRPSVERGLARGAVQARGVRRGRSGRLSARKSECRGTDGDQEDGERNDAAHETSKLTRKLACGRGFG